MVPLRPDTPKSAEPRVETLQVKPRTSPPPSSSLAVALGTFTSWVEQHGKSADGVSFVAGQRRSGLLSADRMYAMITLPTEPRTFKVAIGWDQPDQFRDLFPPRR